jgi:hypothetical protein
MGSCFCLGRAAAAATPFSAAFGATATRQAGEGRPQRSRCTLHPAVGHPAPIPAPLSAASPSPRASASCACATPAAAAAQLDKPPAKSQAPAAAHQAALGAVGIPVADCGGDIEEHKKCLARDDVRCVPEAAAPAMQGRGSGAGGGGWGHRQPGVGRLAGHFAGPACSSVWISGCLGVPPPPSCCSVPAALLGPPDAAGRALGRLQPGALLTCRSSPWPGTHL